MLLRSREYWIAEGVAWPGSPGKDDEYRRHSSLNLQSIADHLADNLPKGFRVSNRIADIKGWKVALKLTSPSGEYTVRIFTSSTAVGMVVRVISQDSFQDKVFSAAGEKKKISSWVNGRLVGE